jgi:hypothetical protein
MATLDSTEATPATTANGGRLLATIALVAGLAISVVALAVGLTTWGREGGFESTPLGEIGASVFAVTLLAVGFVLRSRRPENTIGVLFLVFGIIVALSALAWDVMLVGALPGGDEQMGAIAAWLGAVTSIATWTYLLIAIVIRFPDGVAQSHGEEMVLRWLPVPAIAAAIAVALRPGRMQVYPAFDNPITTPPGLHGLPGSTGC